MVTTIRRIHCAPDEVFRVLANGWLYPGWVVGAARMRDVDLHWPARGARLQHSVGVWPLLVNDSTSCDEWDPPRRMVLTARGWPLGKARVVIAVAPCPEGSLVEIDEVAVSGPAKLIPPVLTNRVLRWRNRETLHRLAYLAEGQSEESDASGELRGAGEGSPS